MPATSRANPPTATKAHGFRGISLSRSHRVFSRRTAGSVAAEAFRKSSAGARHSMAAVDPGVGRRDAFERTTRLATRLLALLAYGACVAALFLAVRPLLPKGQADPVVLPEATTPQIYVAHPGDTLATVAATHGLGLETLFALNPDVTPLALRPGTQIQVD